MTEENKKSESDVIVHDVRIAMAAILRVVEHSVGFKGDVEELKKTCKEQFATAAPKKGKKRERKEEAEPPKEPEKEKEKTKEKKTTKPPKEDNSKCPGHVWNENPKACGKEAKLKKKVNNKMILLCDECVAAKLAEDKLAKQAAKKKQKAEPKKVEEQPKEEEGEEQEEEEEEEDDE
jgi:ribosomal protein L12E/L44/L45/RPP1/RPP2